MNKRVQRLCQTCLGSFDDSDLCEIDDGDHFSIHCKKCTQEYGLNFFKNLKDNKVKIKKDKEKQK